MDEQELVDAVDDLADFEEKMGEGITYVTDRLNPRECEIANLELERRGCGSRFFFCTVGTVSEGPGTDG